MHRNTPNGIAFGSVQGPELGLADAYRVCQHGLEHRLKFAGRGADDFQHFGGRRLLLRRLTALAGRGRGGPADRQRRARPIGALRALSLVARRPFTGCPLLPRRCMSPASGGSRRSSILGKFSHSAPRDRCPLWVKSGHVRCNSDVR